MYSSAGLYPGHQDESGLLSDWRTSKNTQANCRCRQNVFSVLSRASGMLTPAYANSLDVQLRTEVGKHFLWRTRKYISGFALYVVPSLLFDSALCHRHMSMEMSWGVYANKTLFTDWNFNHMSLSCVIKNVKIILSSQVMQKNRRWAVFDPWANLPTSDWELLFNRG